MSIFKTINRKLTFYKLKKKNMVGEKCVKCHWRKITSQFSDKCSVCHVEGGI